LTNDTNRRPGLDQLRLVATDYDGTLLGPERVITPYTRAVLRDLADSHLELMVTTGRPPRFCEDMLDELGIPLTLICANGAVAYDPATTTVTQFATLDLDHTHELIDMIRAEHPEAGLCAELGYDFVAEQRWFEATGRSPVTQVDDLRDHLDDRVHKLLVSLPDHDAEQAFDRIAPMVGHRANPTHAGLAFVELMPPGVDKAFGLERFCAAHGLGPDQVVAFGDMPNDNAMLQWAGWGVAMGNAHHSTKAAAKEVTASHAEDGVAQVVAEILAGRS